MRLNRVEIEPYWDAIKESVSNLVKGSHARAEDVYAACKYGHAHLFISEDVYIVFQEQNHQMDHEKELFIWLAERLNNKTNIMYDYQEEVIEIARGVGAKRIVFLTTRPGFLKALPSGWRMRYTTYELEI